MTHPLPDLHRMTSQRPRVVPVRDDERTEVDTTMRARQLASTVRQGRKISVQILDDYPIEGYLCGWDPETYFVIIPNAIQGNPPVKRLIPKAAIQFIDLHDDRTFFEEPDHELMADVVKKFRNYINNAYFTAER